MEDLAGVWLDLFGLGFGWDLFWSWRIWLGFESFDGLFGLELWLFVVEFGWICLGVL